MKTFIQIEAKKWCDINGNTYHTVQIVDKDENVYTSPVTYGYGSQWETTALSLIELNCIKSDSEIACTFDLYTANDICVFDSGYVKRKKDLH